MSIRSINTNDNLEIEEPRIRRFQKKFDVKENQRKQNRNDEFIRNPIQNPKKQIVFRSPFVEVPEVTFNEDDDTYQPIVLNPTTKTESETKENNLEDNTEKLLKLLQDRLGLNEKQSQEFLDNWDKEIANAFDEYNTEDGDVSEEDIERLQKLGEQVYENSKGNDAIKNQAGNDEAIMDRLTKDLLHERMLLMKEKTWINYWNANNQGTKASAKLAASLSA
jgi:hypothetical protein